MNREDIIKLAREAGFYVNEKARQHQPNCISHTYHMIDAQLERFAALVAAHEREACAQLCENLKMHPDQGDCWVIGTIDCADAIRARGE